MEASNMNVIDQYLYLLGSLIIILVTLYKAYDVNKFRNSENIRYKSYINEINFQFEDKSIENEKVNLKSSTNTYEDIFGE
jgi:hypothetical protein